MTNRIHEVVKQGVGRKRNGAVLFNGTRTVKSWPTIRSGLDRFQIVFLDSAAPQGCFSATTTVTASGVSKRGITVLALEFKVQFYET